MNREPRWIGRRVLDVAHDELISHFGGLSGMRDEHVLESVIARPIQLFQYGNSVTFAQLCAAYGYGITVNHPFNDGNKRTGFAAMMVCAGFNGCTIAATEESIVRMMMGVASGHINEEELTYWLDKHLVSVEPS